MERLYEREAQIHEIKKILYSYEKTFKYKILV